MSNKVLGTIFAFGMCAILWFAFGDLIIAKGADAAGEQTDKYVENVMPEGTDPGVTAIAKKQARADMKAALSGEKREVEVDTRTDAEFQADQQEAGEKIQAYEREKAEGPQTDFDSLKD